MDHTIDPKSPFYPGENPRLDTMLRRGKKLDNTGEGQPGDDTGVALPRRKFTRIDGSSADPDEMRKGFEQTHPTARQLEGGQDKSKTYVVDKYGRTRPLRLHTRAMDYVSRHWKEGALLALASALIYGLPLVAYRSSPVPEEQNPPAVSSESSVNKGETYIIRDNEGQLRIVPAELSPTPWAGQGNDDNNKKTVKLLEKIMQDSEEGIAHVGTK